MVSLFYSLQIACSRIHNNNLVHQFFPIYVILRVNHCLMAFLSGRLWTNIYSQLSIEQIFDLSGMSDLYSQHGVYRQMMIQTFEDYGCIYTDVHQLRSFRALYPICTFEIYKRCNSCYLNKQESHKVLLLTNQPALIQDKQKDRESCILLFCICLSIPQRIKGFRFGYKYFSYSFSPQIHGKIMAFWCQA